MLQANFEFLGDHHPCDQLDLDHVHVQHLDHPKLDNLELLIQLDLRKPKNPFL